MVKLGEVLKQDKNYLDNLEPIKYKKLSVKLYGKGVVLDDSVNGATVRMKKHQLAKAGQVIVSEIWAKKGAIGVVPNEGEGALCTSHFFLFDCIEEEIYPPFFHLFIIGNLFEAPLSAKAQGTTGYAATRPKDFFDLEIPLPPLSEQQRIAGRLAALKGKSDAVRALRGDQEKMKSAFRNGLFNQICRNFDMVTLQSVLIPRKEVVAVAPQTEYNQITVKMQHKGVVLRGTVLGAEVGSVQLRAKEGDFIISKIDARNGAMGIVPKSLDNAIVTNDFPLFSFSSDCLPKYFEFVSNTDYFDQKCIQSSEGTTNRVRLKMDRFANIGIPLPPLSEQKRVVEILEKIDALQEIQSGQLTALEGLFPGVLEKAFRGEW